MKEAPVRVAWRRRIEAGGCNGCNDAGYLPNVAVRLCRTCADLLVRGLRR